MKIYRITPEKFFKLSLLYYKLLGMVKQGCKFIANF